MARSLAARWRRRLDGGLLDGGLDAWLHPGLRFALVAVARFRFLRVSRLRRLRVTGHRGRGHVRRRLGQGCR